MGAAVSFKHPFFDPAIDPRVSKLWDYGHFHETDVKKSDLKKLKVTDKPSKVAIASYQGFMSDDFHTLAKQFHGRLGDVDGVTGPATDTLIEMPRCSVPDFGVSMEAKFPDSCVNAITISYLFDSIAKDVADRAWKHALKAWSAVIEMGFDLLDSFTHSSHVWATDSALRGSILAWSMLNVGRCAPHEQRYNQLVRWEWEYLSRTQQHELGHAFGMGHHNSRSAIMYPSIQPHMSPQPPDIVVMQRLGYKKRVGPPPPDDDEPPTPFPGGWTGQLVNSSSGQKINLFGLPA